MDVPPIQNPPVQNTSPLHRRSHIVRFLIIGVFMLTLGLFGGFYLGRTSQYNIGPPQDINPTESPQGRGCTLEAKVCPDGSAVGRIGQNCEFAPCPTQIVSPTKPASAKIVIPADWKRFEATDQEFKITASLYLEPGYTFEFTGSEWNIRNIADSSELWDYRPSTQYNGESRRVWYQAQYPTLKILKVEEVPVNDSSYLKFDVDNNGKTVHHYLYVKNGIANIFTPMSEKAYSGESSIDRDMKTIISSLEVSQK